MTLVGAVGSVPGREGLIVVVVSVSSSVFPDHVAVAVRLGREPERALSTLVRLLSGVRQDVAVERGSPGELSRTIRARYFVRSC